MKTFFLLFFLPIYCLAQGTIEIYPDFSPHYLTFLQNNRFEYKKMFCKGNDIAYGHYEIKNKKLTLFFETDTTLLTKKTIVKTTPSTTDSVQIRVKVLDAQDNKALHFATVECFNTKKNVFTTSTDTSGTVQFSLYKNNEPLKITANFIGFLNTDYSITPNQNHDLTIFIVGNSFDICLYKAGNTKQFKIKNVTKNGFELKNKYKYQYYVIK